MADLAFGFHAGSESETIELLDLAVVRDIEVVQQVVVEIADAALLQLFGEDAFLVALGLEKHRRQLGRQREGVAAVTLDQRAAHDLLALEFVIHVGRVEVGEPAFQEGVDHPFDLRDVYFREVFRVGERQAHAPEPQFLGRHHLAYRLRFITPMIARPPNTCSSMPGMPSRKSCMAVLRSPASAHSPSVPIVW